jgi:hypothetical protein
LAHGRVPSFASHETPLGPLAEQPPASFFGEPLGVSCYNSYEDSNTEALVIHGWPAACFPNGKTQIKAAKGQSEGC